MNWQETVLTPDLRMLLSPHQDNGYKLANQQAEISWKARQKEVDEAEQRGIRKVVDEISKVWDMSSDNFYEFGRKVFDIWQAFLKGGEKMKQKNDNAMDVTFSSGGKTVTTSLENLKRFERLLKETNKKSKHPKPK